MHLCLVLAVGYAIYLTKLPPNHYAKAAFTNSFLLAQGGYASWVTDLQAALSSLPEPVVLTGADFADAESLLRVQTTISASCSLFWRTQVDNSAKCYMIQGRTDHSQNGTSLRFRDYLQISIPAYRRAFTTLVLSDHALAVQRLRYPERHRLPIPREWRLCRFCRLQVETEYHALLECELNDDLVVCRQKFLEDIYVKVPELRRLRLSLDAKDFLLCLLRCVPILNRVGKFIFDVLAIFDTIDIFVPAGHLYAPFM